MIHNVAAIIGSGSHAKLLRTAFSDGTVFCSDSSVPEDMYVCIGVGNVPQTGKSDLKTRRTLYLKFKKQRIVGVEHESSTILGDVDLTCQIMPCAIVNHGATVCENTILNTGSIVEHDCSIGAHCHIAPGAVVLGGVRIGEETHVGANSVILPGMRIGRGCVIAAGAVVTDDMDDYQTWIGHKLYE